MANTDGFDVPTSPLPVQSSGPASYVGKQSADQLLQQAQANRENKGSVSLNVPVSQARSKAYEQDRAITTTQSVREPPPPLAFQGLQTGPELNIGYEPPRAIPISQAQNILKTLSPFMIQVEPPLVFASDGAFTAPVKKTVNVGLYTAAQGGVSGYDASRTRLAQSAINNIATNPSGGQQAVVKNANSPRQNATPKGDRADNTGMDSSRLGQPAIADVMTALDIAWQLSVSINTPPLVLLINPDSLSLNITKIQQYQDRSRFGYIFHSWGDDQPKLSISAKCGAYMSSGRGVQYASKRDSASWQNLMNLFHFYQNNGYIYNSVDKSNAHHFVGALSIHYDQWIYYGNMESFSFTEDESLPGGGMEFSMEFTVSVMQDTAQQPFVVTPMRSPIPSLSDPRYQGLVNRARNQPGNFSVGLDDDGNIQLSTQGRQVSANEAFSSLLPQQSGQLLFEDPDFAPGLPPLLGSQGQQEGTLTQPATTGAFQDAVTAPPTGGRPVNEVDEVRINKFEFAQAFSS